MVQPDGGARQRRRQRGGAAAPDGRRPARARFPGAADPRRQPPALHRLAVPVVGRLRRRHARPPLHPAQAVAALHPRARARHDVLRLRLHGPPLGLGPGAPAPPSAEIDRAPRRPAVRLPEPRPHVAAHLSRGHQPVGQHAPQEQRVGAEAGHRRPAPPAAAPQHRPAVLRAGAPGHAGLGVRLHRGVRGRAAGRVRPGLLHDPLHLLPGPAAQVGQHVLAPLRRVGDPGRRPRSLRGVGHEGVAGEGGATRVLPAPRPLPLGRGVDARKGGRRDVGGQGAPDRGLHRDRGQAEAPRRGGADLRHLGGLCRGVRRHGACLEEGLSRSGEADNMSRRVHDL